MRVDTRVALAAHRDFTGTVTGIRGDVITVEFDCGGRGWLKPAHLVELSPVEEPTERTTRMIVTNSRVALARSISTTGIVVATDSAGADVALDHSGEVKHFDLSELVEISDVHLPGDDKAWPPSNLETKASP